MTQTLAQPETLNNTTALFRAYSDQDAQVTVELMNSDHQPVGALYLSKMTMDNLIVSETNNKERYFLYYYGIGVYFTYWRKLPNAK